MLNEDKSKVYNPYRIWVGLSFVGLVLVASGWVESGDMAGQAIGGAEEWVYDRGEIHEKCVGVNGKGVDTCILEQACSNWNATSLANFIPDTESRDAYQGSKDYGHKWLLIQICSDYYYSREKLSQD